MQTQQSGALKYNVWNSSSNGYINGAPAGLISANIQFSAWDSNRIYGNSSTVQPNSLCLKYIIKYT